VHILRLLFPTQTLILLVVTLHTSNILFPLIYVFYIMYTPNLGGRLPLLEQLLYYFCSCSSRCRSFRCRCCSCWFFCCRCCSCWVFFCWCCSCLFFCWCCCCCRSFCSCCRRWSNSCRCCCCCCLFSLSLERRNIY